ncbi:MAG: type II toxin-antitoxin system Phd/YefM family antitoxin [Caldilinea sp.]|nr:type II toxin-antitoxin system Phd/YefM family antitoxin [Caldilinea sp.]MDW8442229.1 type II toxin-antitoxin system Phd/YefM family antitoxin [Caldilineaceae bacterium]
MTAIHLSVTEFRRNVSKHLERVVDRRQRFILLQRGRPVAELRPLPVGCTLGELEKTLRMLPRFTEAEAAAFETELRAARPLT